MKSELLAALVTLRLELATLYELCLAEHHVVGMGAARRAMAACDTAIENLTE